MSFRKEASLTVLFSDVCLGGKTIKKSKVTNTTKVRGSGRLPAGEGHGRSGAHNTLFYKRGGGYTCVSFITTFKKYVYISYFPIYMTYSTLKIKVNESIILGPLDK